MIVVLTISITVLIFIGCTTFTATINIAGVVAGMMLLSAYIMSQEAVSDTTLGTDTTTVTSAIVGSVLLVEGAFYGTFYVDALCLQ